MFLSPIWKVAAPSFQVGIEQIFLQLEVGMSDYIPANFHDIWIQFASPNIFSEHGFAAIFGLFFSTLRIFFLLRFFFLLDLSIS